MALPCARRGNDPLGVFARLGWNGGGAQNFMVTEMDWSVSAGISVNGWSWGISADTLGLAFILGGLHGPQWRFLAAGGNGLILGDGRLNSAPETVFGVFYDVGLAPGLNAAAGLPLVASPGYNADRSPVSVATRRLRAAF